MSIIDIDIDIDPGASNSAAAALRAATKHACRTAGLDLFGW